VIADKPDPTERSDRMDEDLRLFKREIVRRYVETVIRVIREEDPGHLVFSNYFLLDDVTKWICCRSVRSFRCDRGQYLPGDLSAGLNQSERAILALVHSKTSKSILIPEWSIPALDSGLYGNPNKLDWPYRERWIHSSSALGRQPESQPISSFALRYRSALVYLERHP
jgi:hypothetical protein